MASLMVFRKKTVPTDTEYGDNIGVVAPGKSTISEDLSEQVSEGVLSYKTSAEFSANSTRVYLNGIYMTNGVDYIESEDRFILFSHGHSKIFISSENTTLSIVYSSK